MIHLVSGDILRTRAQVLAHGVAPNDPMTQGLALAIREMYPALHKDYHHWCSQQHPKPGSAWLWGAAGGVRIVNLLTQEGGYGVGARPGRATLHNVREALRALAKMVAKEGFESVALPKLATGVGALAWSDVLPVIEDRMGALGIPVYVYAEYQPGQVAEEPDLETSHPAGTA
ncbi:MAG: macro domain-containing protein [Acidobacteria bacterium]|nr:macro domain-containing protein [Acidobacteriota bacterium]